MNTKNNKKVYSKPVAEKPKEEIIEQQTEEITESHSIDSEVFETKLFVPEDEIWIEKPSLDELQEELTKQLATPEPEKTTEEFVKDNELKEKLEELKTKFEEFQTVQVEPIIPEPEIEYTLTPEQEKEGAQAVADMVNNQIIEELKALNYVPKESVTEKINGEYFLTEKQANPEKTLESLSQHELRHFHRTGQMPK